MKKLLFWCRAAFFSETQSVSPFGFFGISSALLIACDGQLHTVRVEYTVNRIDDSKYRVLKITSPPGRMVLKRTNHTTYRSFSRPPKYSSTLLDALIKPHKQTHRDMTLKTPRLANFFKIVELLLQHTFKADHIVLVIFTSLRYPHPSGTNKFSLWDKLTKRGALWQSKIFKRRQ